MLGTVSEKQIVMGFYCYCLFLIISFETQMFFHLHEVKFSNFSLIVPCVSCLRNCCLIQGSEGLHLFFFQEF